MAGPPMQLPAQMDISMKHFFSRPCLMSSRAARHVLDAVYHQVGVVGGIALHGAQDAAGGGEQPGTALLQVVLPLLHGDALLLQPVGELLEGEDAVGVARVGVGLGFFRDAGPDEHGLGASGCSCLIFWQWACMGDTTVAR